MVELIEHCLECSDKNNFAVTINNKNGVIPVKRYKVLPTAAPILALLSTNVSASASSITTMEQLDKRFNLQPVTEIPEAVIPLAFD